MPAHDCGGTWAESGFVRLLDLNAGLASGRLAGRCKPGPPEAPALLLTCDAAERGDQKCWRR